MLCTKTCARRYNTEFFVIAPNAQIIVVQRSLVKNAEQELWESGKSLTAHRQNPNEEYYQKLLQSADEKHQDIIYWKFGKFETVHPLSWTQIDLQKALDETQKLLPEYDESIGFSNGRNKDAIHFTRVGKDRWKVQVPIFTRPEWDGYYWRAATNTKLALDTIRLFFDELEWFGMLGFKMRRNSEG